MNISTEILNIGSRLREVGPKERTCRTCYCEVSSTIDMHVTGDRLVK